MNTQHNDWWRGAVIYQIYPRSFMDSNGDGIGDIPGIISKLDYIAGLNVDAIWLSPFFTSPMKDFGYDIADYRDVDPMFGSLEDFKKLVKEAHARNLKIIIDQVYSHSSDQCEWFKESRKDKNNPKSDWYVWADAKPDGTPPNNWLSIFGGSAWQWDSRRKQYYLHNFLASQPDLNFHNPEVQQASLDTARFWLDLGVDGFRLDVVTMYFHDAQLRDNPIVSKPEEQFVGVAEDNPFSRQYHLHQVCQEENLAFLQKLRKLLDQYPGSTTVGEVGAPDGMSYMALYTSGGDKIHMAYTFELLADNCEPEFIKHTLQRVESKLSDGWPSLALSNHDVVRSASRWTQNSEYPQLKARAMLILLLTQRGTPCLYQGEELGLPEGEVSYEQLQDPFGIEFWPDFKGRDGCRTPMPWNHQPNLGFSETSQTWLPCQVKHKPYVVTEQLPDSGSMLTFSKHFLEWRRLQSAIKTGRIEWLSSPDSILLYQRIDSSQRLLIAINFSEETASFSSPEQGKLVWGKAPKDDSLLPYQCCIWSMETG